MEVVFSPRNLAKYCPSKMSRVAITGLIGVAGNGTTEEGTAIVPAISTTGEGAATLAGRTRGAGATKGAGITRGAKITASKYMMHVIKEVD